MILPDPFNLWFHLLQERFFLWLLFIQDSSTVLENPGASTIIIRDLYRLESKGPITERDERFFVMSRMSMDPVARVSTGQDRRPEG